MTDLAPVQPQAATLRRALRKAGIEHLVSRITSGKESTRVWVRDDRDTGEALAKVQVAEALRPLWTDGDERVWEGCTGNVVVSRERWYYTLPGTPEGFAELKCKEDERNDALMNTQAFMEDRLESSTGSTLRYMPDTTYPRKPWRDWTGKRFTPFEVYIR